MADVNAIIDKAQTGYMGGAYGVLRPAWAVMVAGGDYRALPPRGDSFIAGQPPDGLVTFNGAPAVRVVDVFDRATNILVASTTSAADGTYRINGLRQDRLYDVRARGSSDLENDLIVARVTPHLPEVTFQGTFQPYGYTTVNYSSYIAIRGGNGSYTNPQVLSGALPAGLELSIVGDRLYLSGTLGATQAIYNFTVSVDSTDGQRGSTPQTVEVVANDPHFANVVSLLSFDDGFHDLVEANLWTVNGKAAIDTDNKRFGSGSAYFPNNTLSPLSTPDRLDLRMESADFTIEGFFNPQAPPNGFGIFYGKGINTPNGLSIGVTPTTITVRRNSLSDFVINATVNPWDHVAIVRNAGVINVFLRGVNVGSSPVAFTNTDADVLYVGSNSSTIGNPNYSYAGNIDEFRITKGVARYTDNFTPTTKPFPRG